MKGGTSISEVLISPRIKHNDCTGNDLQPLLFVTGTAIGRQQANRKEGIGLFPSVPRGNTGTSTWVRNYLQLADGISPFH